MDQLMNVCDRYLFQGVANVIGFQRILGPKFLGLRPDETAIEAAMPKAHAVFRVLGRELGERPHLTGEQLTLADLILAPQLDLLAQTPEWNPLTREQPNLRSWMTRIQARPSVLATTLERVFAMAEAA